MPGLSAVPVSLNEVIEVRNGALSADEIWSLIFNLCPKLHTLVDIGAAPIEFDNAAVCSADCIYLYADGTIACNILPIAEVNDNSVVPPELQKKGADTFDPAAAFVYCLGAMFNNALELSEHSQSTPELHSWLNLMRVPNPKGRPTLNKLNQIAKQQLTKEGNRLSDEAKIAEDNISIMHKTIMGDDDELESSGTDIDQLQPVVNGGSTNNDLPDFLRPDYNPFLEDEIEKVKIQREKDEREFVQKAADAQRALQEEDEKRKENARLQKEREEKERIEIEKRQQEEIAIRRQQEEDRKKQEEEMKKHQEERRRQEEEEERKRLAAQALAMAEKLRKEKEEDERRKKAVELETKRLEQERQKKLEEEAKRRLEYEKMRQEEEEKKRREEEQKRLEEEEKKKREEEQKKVEEEEKRRREEEQKKLEDEEKRRQEEEQRRLEEEENIKRKEEQMRLEKEVKRRQEEEQKRLEEEEKRRRDEEQKRFEEEEKRKREEEQKRLEEIEKRRLEEEQKRLEEEKKLEKEAERRRQEELAAIALAKKLQKENDEQRKKDEEERLRRRAEENDKIRCEEEEAMRKRIEEEKIRQEEIERIREKEENDRLKKTSEATSRSLQEEELRRVADWTTFEHDNMKLEEYQESDSMIFARSSNDPFADNIDIDTDPFVASSTRSDNCRPLSQIMPTDDIDLQNDSDRSCASLHYTEVVRERIESPKAKTRKSLPDLAIDTEVQPQAAQRKDAYKKHMRNRSNPFGSFDDLSEVKAVVELADTETIERTDSGDWIVNEHDSPIRQNEKEIDVDRMPVSSGIKHRSLSPPIYQASESKIDANSTVDDTHLEHFERNTLRRSSMRRKSKNEKEKPQIVAVHEHEPLEKVETTIIHENSLEAVVPQPSTSYEKPIGVSTDLTANTLPKSILKDKNKARFVRTSSQMGGPEFLYKSRLESIRLKHEQKKKSRASTLLHRTEQTSVHVTLLNGQKIEIACSSDDRAGELFSLVVGHIDLKENAYFGLTALIDGEHFFLSADDKLAKYAPPGWRHHTNQRNQASSSLTPNKCNYNLYFRIKCYPPGLEFIEKSGTRHELYLQLRRDVLEDALVTNRDTAFALAAIAMQAECADRPSPDAIRYFSPDHFLPNRHLLVDREDDRVRQVLAELHSQYAGLTRIESEEEFIKKCQEQKEYGIHFHRLFKRKQSAYTGNMPFGDPDTGTTTWLGIMYKGLIIFEERAGERVPISHHAWHRTQSLEYNRKKFIIVPQNDSYDASIKAENQPNALVFYTDNHKKSAYFVKFAAAQHKFGLKMRLKAATLQKDSTLQRDFNKAQHRISKTSADSGTVADLASRECSPDEKIAMMIAQQEELKKQQRLSVQNGPQFLDISATTHDRSLPLEALDATPSSNESDYTTFTVDLIKDRNSGLGMTLVDGEIQGVKGVYIKNLDPQGPAAEQGKLRIGDKIWEVNGEPIEKKNRHEVVNIVRQSGPNVNMIIVRLKSLMMKSEANNNDPSHRSSNSIVNDLSTSVAMRSVTDVTPQKNKYRRHVTDLGQGSASVGAPHFDSNAISQQFYKVSDTPSGKRKTVSDINTEAFGLGAMVEHEPMLDTSALSLAGQYQPAKLNSRTNSASSMNKYLGLDDSTEDEDDDEQTTTKSKTLPAGLSLADHMPERAPALESRTCTESHKSDNADWTNRWNRFEELGPGHEVTVQLEKTPKGALGLKIAGGGKDGTAHVFIKAFVGEPAASCRHLMIGDLLMSINGQTTQGMQHSDVVQILKTATSPVTLGLWRLDNVSKEAMTKLTVKLEKASDTEPLGLSLATITGSQGIYIRAVTENTTAARNGILQKGDLLSTINGENVEAASSRDVVEKLKKAGSTVVIEVKRDVN